VLILLLNKNTLLTCLGAFLLLLRHYGIKLIPGRPRALNAQGLEAQSNGIVMETIVKWMNDNSSTFWHMGLTEVANQINGLIDMTRLRTPFEPAFRRKMPIVCLTTKERRETEGVTSEDGELITEESLSKELEEEKDEDLLAGFRELSGYLNIRTPALQDLAGEKQPAVQPSQQPKPPVSPPKVLPPTPRVSRVVPLHTASDMLTPQNAQKASSIKITPVPAYAPLPRATAPEQLNQDEPQAVIIRSKAFGRTAELAIQYPAGRPIAYAQLAPASMGFHNHTIPPANILLFFESIVETELSLPIPGGQLDYTDPDCEAINISGLLKGHIFHWEKVLVSPHIIQPSQESLHTSDSSASQSVSGEDKVTKQRNTNNNQAGPKRVTRFSKNEVIEQFAVGDVVALKLPKGSRASTDMRRVFGRVLSIAYDNHYIIQTEWGIVGRVLLAIELIRVAKSVANGIKVHGPNVELSLTEVAKHASIAERESISCKCAGVCSTKRCRCFKEGRKCSVYCHEFADQNCGILAGLALQGELALEENPTKKGGTKRQRANTTGKVVKR
jgi:hypothetical protein